MNKRMWFLMIGMVVLGLQTGLAQTNKELAKMYYEEVLSQGKLELAKDRFSPDAIHHDPNVPGGQWPKGPAITDALLAVFRTAFSDFSTKVLAQYEEGNIVVTRFQTTGVHTGPFNGIPATGKKITYTGTNIARFEKGMVVEDWTYWDLYGVLVQMGVIPAPGK